MNMSNDKSAKSAPATDKPAAPAPAAPALTGFLAYLAAQGASGATLAPASAFPAIPAPDAPGFVDAVCAAAAFCGTLRSVTDLADPKARDSALYSELGARLNKADVPPFSRYVDPARTYRPGSPKAGRHYWTGLTAAALVTDCRAAKAAAK